MKKHRCVCGEDFAEDGWHGLSCLKSAGQLDELANFVPFDQKAATKWFFKTNFFWELVQLYVCHSPGLAQRNLPSQHEEDIRGLSDHVL